LKEKSAFFKKKSRSTIEVDLLKGQDYAAKTESPKNTTQKKPSQQIFPFLSTLVGGLGIKNGVNQTNESPKPPRYLTLQREEVPSAKPKFFFAHQNQTPERKKPLLNLNLSKEIRDHSWDNNPNIRQAVNDYSVAADEIIR